MPIERFDIPRKYLGNAVAATHLTVTTANARPACRQHLQATGVRAELGRVSEGGERTVGRTAVSRRNETKGKR